MTMVNTHPAASTSLGGTGGRPGRLGAGVEPSYQGNCSWPHRLRRYTKRGQWGMAPEPGLLWKNPVEDHSMGPEDLRRWMGLK